MRINITTSTLTRMAMLITLNIILTRWLSIRIPIGGVEGIRLGFGEFPVYFAGVLLGPLAGGIVGAVGDLIGYFINPMGAYMPHFTLAAALRGIIPGLILVLLSGGRKRHMGIVPLFLSLGLTAVIVNILMVPYFIETLFGLSRIVTVPPRIIANAISIPLFVALLIYLDRIMAKIFVPGSGRAMPQLSGKLW